MKQALLIVWMSFCLSSLLYGEGETGSPIRVWIMPTSARYVAPTAVVERLRAVADFRNEWDHLLDLTEDEYAWMQEHNPDRLYDLLGQTNVLRDIRDAFYDSDQVAGMLAENGIWYPLKIRFSVWEWGAWQADFSQSMNAGLSPDLIEVGTTWVSYLAAQKKIIAWRDETRAAATEVYHQGLMKALRYDDKSWAWPRQVDIRVLFTHAGRIGRFHGQPTWTGLRAVLNTNQPFSMPALQNAFHAFAAVSYASGVDMFRVEDGHLRPAAPDDLNEGFKFVAELGPSFRMLAPDESVGYRFAHGELAATVGGADLFLHLRNENRDDDAWHAWAQVFPLPADIHGDIHVWLGGSGLAITASYGKDCLVESDRASRRRAIEQVAERFTRTGLALHVACPADHAMRRTQFASLGDPGAAYLAIVEGSHSNVQLVSYPPHPDILRYEAGPNYDLLIESIQRAMQGDQSAAWRLHERWVPVAADALMSIEGAILSGLSLLILVLIVMNNQRARAARVELERMEQFMAAALAPYVVGIHCATPAQINSRPANDSLKGYGTLMADHHGTSLVTAEHVLRSAGFNKNGIELKTLAGRPLLTIGKPCEETEGSGVGFTSHAGGHSGDIIIQVTCRELEALPGIAIAREDRAGADVYGTAIRNQEPQFFCAHLEHNETGFWRQRPDGAIPDQGDSGMGLFAVEIKPGQELTICLAGIFCSKEKNKMKFFRTNRLLIR